MLQILIILIIIGVVWEFLKEKIAAIFSFILGLGLIIGFVAITGPIGVIIALIIGGIYYTNKMNKEKNVEVERTKERTAYINAREGEKSREYLYEMQLKEELDRNCKYLGVMNENRWRRQLLNFVNKGYDKLFDETTLNFAKQMEEQYIVKTADVWMKQFEEYIVQRPSGTPVHKMLEEVDCEVLRITHITPTYKILEYYLTQGTKRLSEDLPAKFKVSQAGDYTFYQPTPYLEHLYKNSGFKQREKAEEIVIDDNDEWSNLF